MRVLLLVLAYFFSSCQLSADPPEKVLIAFKAKYPNAEKVTWSVDRNTRHEAGFIQDGSHFRADFEADGTWVETETSVKWDEVPEAAKAAFNKEDKKKDIIEIELVDSKKEGRFYDIEYKTDGHKQDIRITPNGEVLGTDRH